MQRNQKLKVDVFTIVIYVILLFFGLISISSSSYDGLVLIDFSTSTIVGKQFIFIIFSMFLGNLILFLDGKLFVRFGYFFYFFSILSLVFVLIFGKEVGGAKAWFSFGQFGLQPAEFAKLATILAIAKFIHDKDIYLNTFKNLLIIIFFLLPPIFLILLQPDAGSALVFGGLIVVFYREGLQLRYIFTVIILILLSFSTLFLGVSKSIIFLILVTIFLTYIFKKQKGKFLISLIFFITCTLIVTGVNYTYENILEPHQRVRIDIITGKTENKLGAGYNLNQSLIAIGSGGAFGKGYLEGTQTKGNFIPEQNTDFIFCTVGEEFGFFGCFVLITLFATLIIRILILSEKQTTRFNRIIGYAISSIISIHVIINIGMTIGLVPVIGIPLPFLSYGGSSMLAFSIMLFLFLKLDSLRNERF